MTEDIEIKENLYTYLRNVFRCNYGETQWAIGYTGIQNRYLASIGKITVLHDCVTNMVTDVTHPASHHLVSPFNTGI